MKAFTLYLPPGWYRIDLMDDAETSISRFTSSLVRSAPLSRQPTLRRLLVENVEPTIREYAAKGAACVVVPIAAGPVDPIKPLVVFTPFEGPPDVDPLMMLQGLAGQDDTAVMVDIVGAVAVRTHASADSSAAAEAAQPLLDDLREDPAIPRVPIDTSDLVAPGETLTMVSRRVQYIIGVPDDRERWVLVQMAVNHPTTAAAEGLAQDAVDLFDAVIATFRWVS